VLIKYKWLKIGYMKDKTTVSSTKWQNYN